MSYDVGSEKLELTSTQAGNASLQLRNTQAASTAGGLEIYDDSDTQVMQIGFNNNTDESYIWSRGDNFYKLAHEFYGDASMWWVIPLFNHTPTEQHLSLGDEIFIPLEPEAIISLLGV